MKKIRILLFSLLLINALLFLKENSMAAESCDQWAGKVVKVQGEVFVKKSDQSDAGEASMNDRLCAGDMILVSEHSRAAVLLPNETVAHLDQNTTLIFTAKEEEEFSLIELLKGALNLISRTPRTLEVITPFMNAGVEGTEFLVRVMKDAAMVTVFEGTVKASNSAGTLWLAKGQSAVAEAGKTPEQRVMVRPRDSVRWALYYPPILHVSEIDFPDSSSGWQGSLRESLKYFWKGDLSNAFSSIEDVPDKIPDPRFYLYRASLLLTVGRVDEAQDSIAHALSLGGTSSDAMALQSVIAVVQNDKTKAADLAEKAVEADPSSASAQIALSYARQAGFDLDGALASIRKAVELEPDNGLAWARLAELQLSHGNLDEALKSAGRAVDSNPDLARTQSVFGYAYLTQIKIHDAMVRFERAIVLDQADPLPRMGLGLAKIRAGRLEEGRRDIEIAASLDPNNSLVRSYLGKAYYEEKRNGLSASQYAMAEELDPQDPTPIFYDAIRKQTINRPVEALQDMQKAIELNDNRAMYRSKQLLDEDLAARSASLARIYSDLGFEQLALVEGWKSLNTDPANHSAHRFLADTYSTLPRHEIARVSELLQSQLLQPINSTPVQPSLGESNLRILDGAGPGKLSFNEFNPLFNRNRVALQASGVYGENDTHGEEVVISGIYDRFSVSAGQFHYGTDGFRENNDLHQDIYNVFTQVSLSHQTSVQAEYRHKEIEYGDLQQRFNPDLTLDDFREERNIDSIRVGGRHSFARNSHLLITASYQDEDLNIPDILKVYKNGYGTEAQFMYGTGLFNVTTGIGHFKEDRTDEDIEEGEVLVTEIDTDHTNLYLYGYVNYPEQVNWTLGFSGDFFETDSLDQDENQFNPKFGLTWNPLAGTTIRAAVFRTLKRSLLNDQTLEPTQVAGFNQFFDDEDGGKAWRYGIGIDQKFSEKLYVGGEYSERDLEFSGSKVEFDPFLGPMFSVEEFDVEEKLGRVYAYWTPHSWFALNAEYQYEDIERSRDFIADDSMSSLETDRFSFGATFFHPAGFIVQMKPTYIDQRGSFFDDPSSPTPPIVQGDDQFLVFDALIGYRLPRRYGIITIEAKNLFDEEFNFQDTDPANTRIQPERLILARFTLAL